MQKNRLPVPHVLIVAVRFHALQQGAPLALCSHRRKLIEVTQEEDYRNLPKHMAALRVQVHLTAVLRPPGLAHAMRSRAEERGRHHGHFLHDEGFHLVHAIHEVMVHLLPREREKLQRLLRVEPEGAVNGLATEDARSTIGGGHSEIGALFLECIPEETS
eukprot:7643075-Pyramimonas_sp.AAC.1